MRSEWFFPLAAALAAAACMGDYGYKDERFARTALIVREDKAPVRAVEKKPRAMSEVARHASAGSCWLVIDGKVYDVTKFIPFHPGGSAILQGCGKDATRLFETRPTGSGTAHSSYARETAVKYAIGDVEAGR